MRKELNKLATGVDALMQAAGYVMEEQGSDDIERLTWLQLREDPYALQEFIIQTALERGLDGEAEILAFAENYIETMSELYDEDWEDYEAEDAQAEDF